MEYPLQELTVTNGWSVDYHAFHAVDPSRELITDKEAPWWFKQNMYQARHEGNERLIDLGWYPEGDWSIGAYTLVLYAGDFRGELLREIRTEERQQIVASMNEWFSAVSNGEL